MTKSVIEKLPQQVETTKVKQVEAIIEELKVIETEKQPTPLPSPQKSPIKSPVKHIVIETEII